MTSALSLSRRKGDPDQLSNFNEMSSSNPNLSLKTHWGNTGLRHIADSDEGCGYYTLLGPSLLIGLKEIFRHPLGRQVLTH